MMRLIHLLIVCPLLLLTALSSCDRKANTRLKGQTNTTMTFYGLVVDELGTPLAGVRVEYEVEAYPKDWTFETRGRPNDVSRLSAVTNDQGRFEFVAKGCWLRMVDVALDGYRHFWEMDTSGGK
jgi:hypothetical protein